MTRPVWLIRRSGLGTLRAMLLRPVTADAVRAAWPADRDPGTYRRPTTGSAVEVALQQVADWLPARAAARVLDLSLQSPRLLSLMIERGHTVVHAEAAPGGSTSSLARTGPRRAAAPVRADPRSPDWLADASVDVVVAEGGVLSRRWPPS